MTCGNCSENRQLQGSFTCSLWPPVRNNGQTIMFYSCDLFISRGTISFTVFVCVSCLSVGHAVHEIDDLWQQTSRRGVVGSRTKFGSVIDGVLMYVTMQTGELYPGGPMRPPKSEGAKFVTLFSYTVWPTAMKFGTVRAIDR